MGDDWKKTTHNIIFMDGINYPLWWVKLGQVNISYIIYSEFPGMYLLNKGSWMTTLLNIILELMTQFTGSNAYSKRKYTLTLWPEMPEMPHHGFSSLRWLKWWILCLKTCQVWSNKESKRWETKSKCHFNSGKYHTISNFKIPVQ